MPEPPWDVLDPGIVDVVRVIHEAGFETIASCQGHGSEDAWVMVLPPEGKAWVTARALGELLVDTGWDGQAVVSIRWALREPELWIEVRWWGEVPFR